MDFLGRFRLRSAGGFFRSGLMRFFVVWALGLALGCILAPPPTEGATQTLVVMKLGWIPRLILVSAPLALAAFAVYIGEVRLIFLVAFLKALQFSYCGSFLYGMYGSAGWLVRLLCQFADVVAMPAFCWFCIGHISENRKLQKRGLALSAAWIAASAAVDHFVIVPFLANLIDISLEGSLLPCWI